MLIALIIIAVGLLAFDLFGRALGYDSRDGNDWMRHDEVGEQLRFTLTDR